MVERCELDSHLLEFIWLLRKGGISANLTEVHDAFYGLMLIGMEDKSRVEGILQATLVKSVTQVAWFQEAFQVFFAPPEVQSFWKSEAYIHAQNWEKGMAQSREALRFKGEELKLSEEQRVTYLQLPNEEKERIKKYLERAEEGIKNGLPVDFTFQPVVENVLRGSLEFWRRKLRDVDFPFGPPGEVGLLSEVERGMRKKELHYMTRDLKDIPPEEWPEVMKWIQLLSHRLASKASRRLIRGKRGSLDMRRTLRENLRFGGVLVKRRYRTRRMGRPRFVLLCDMSGSMVRYTEFILQFIYGLKTLIRGIETYVFADRLVNLTPKLRLVKSFRGMLQLSLQEVIQEFGGGTNLANALEDILRNHQSALSRQTVFIILSDTQTLEGEKAARLLEKVERKVKKIIWLNTLPKRRWKEVKTIELFRPYCQMFECYTLSHLQGILGSWL
jgi:uncharacterized protein